MKRIKNTILTIVFVLLYCIPIYAVYRLSVSEMSQYEEDRDFEFTEMAYGDVIKAERMDVREYYEVNAVVISDSETVVEIPGGSKTYIHVSEGDEVYEETVLATTAKNNYVSEYNGIVEKIDYGETIRIKITTFENLILKCLIDPGDMDVFNADVLYDEKGESIQILRKSNIVEAGKMAVYLTLGENTWHYGKELTDYRIYTGKVYHHVLVIDKRCIYQKNNDSENYYVRTVNEQGEFIGEEKVSIGYSNGEVVCIGGIDEETFCDAGYKMVIGSSGDW